MIPFSVFTQAQQKITLKKRFPVSHFEQNCSPEIIFGEYSALFGGQYLCFPKPNCHISFSLENREVRSLFSKVELHSKVKHHLIDEEFLSLALKLSFSFFGASPPASFIKVEILQNLLHYQALLPQTLVKLIKFTSDFLKRPLTNQALFRLSCHLANKLKLKGLTLPIHSFIFGSISVGRWNSVKTDYPLQRNSLSPLYFVVAELKANFSKKIIASNWEHFFKNQNGSLRLERIRMFDEWVHSLYKSIITRNYPLMIEVYNLERKLNYDFILKEEPLIKNCREYFTSQGVKALKIYTPPKGPDLISGFLFHTGDQKDLEKINQELMKQNLIKTLNIFSL